MSFVSAAFVPFLAVVWALWMAFPAARRGLLVASGAVFYGWIDPRLLGLLAVSALLDFHAARRIEDDPDRARAWVALSVVGNLGLLGVFKYLGFFVDSVGAALSAVGLDATPGTLALVLPPGISFYTFQTLGYTLDVRAGRVRAERDLVTYLGFVAFFPQLVIGPIERARDLLPQLRALPTPARADLVAGVDLLLWGAVQKRCIADPLAPWVGAAFDAPPSGWLLLAGTVGFTVQVLADLRGYTHMARGAARLFGIRLTPNFDLPYLAPSPQAFWRRWHATLSRWLRDHVYIPMGGARRRARNVVATMALAGLWHGAGWPFVLFGLWHGLWLAVWPRLVRAWPALDRPVVGWLAWQAPLLFGMTLFRAPDLAWLATHLPPSAWVDGPDARALAGATLALTGAGSATLAAAAWWTRRGPDASGPIRLVAWTAAALALATFAPGEAAPFVYWAF